MMSWDDTQAPKWGRLGREERRREAKEVYLGHVKFEVLTEHLCGDIQEIVGYVSSREFLRTGNRNVEVTRILKAWRPTEHNEEKLYEG